MRILVTALVLIVLVAGGYAIRLTSLAIGEELAAPVARREAPWVTSNTCRTCHADHYASWHRTFHRTMTQEATANSIRGTFDGRDVTYWGMTIRPIRRGDRFFFEYLDSDAGKVIATLPILRTVGSHRYQQYLTQVPTGGDTYYRLHLLWHMGDERWVHMNGAFLGPDEQGFDDHIATWNQNCIFCHNTGPAPGVANLKQYEARRLRGEEVDPNRDLFFSSEVAELGIACETCHGPGGEHARRNRNPFRRYFLHLSGQDDPSIVNPDKLPQERSIQVCGQCHGQRTPKSSSHLYEWITTGPTYRSGDDLNEHVKPVFRDSVLPVGVPPDLFRLRFWPDGTARLTAYEYQGILQSACYRRGDVTCISCHTMHEGEVSGMLPPEHRTNKVCEGCHGELVANVSEHSRHAPESSGSKCLSCHMPKIIYGVMEIHRSHRIENPDPAAHTEVGRPNACTLCHVDRSPQWAAAATRTWWGPAYGPVRSRADGADVTTVDSVASLLAGDPVQRAVAAKHSGRHDTPLSAPERAFLVPYLLQAMQDSYPSTRRFAQQSLLGLQADLREAGVELHFSPELDSFDFIGPPEDRQAAVASLIERWNALPKADLPPPPEGSLLDAAYRADPRALARLLRLGAARSRQINIGE